MECNHSEKNNGICELCFEKEASEYYYEQAQKSTVCDHCGIKVSANKKPSYYGTIKVCNKCEKDIAFESKWQEYKKELIF